MDTTATITPTVTPTAHFDRQYQLHLKHLKHLKLKGLQPKTVDGYLAIGGLARGHHQPQAGA